MSIQLLSREETINFLSKADLRSLAARIENETISFVVDHDVECPYTILRGKAIPLFLIMELIGKE